jgi:replicative DNA helicase
MTLMATPHPVFDQLPRVLEMPDRTKPANVEAERAILGTILLLNETYNQAAERLRPEDFSLDSHRRIFLRMQDLAAASQAIDLITLVEELTRKKDLEGVGGVEYVASLLDGVPDRPSIEHYVGIVKGKSLLRRVISSAQLVIARALDGEDVADIVGQHQDALLQVEAETSGRSRTLTHQEAVAEALRSLEEQAQRGGLVGLPTGLSSLDELTGGLREGELVVIGALPGSGKTAFASQIIKANCEAGNPVAVFSIEMSTRSINHRLFSAATAVSATQIRHPRQIKPSEWVALAAGAAEIAAWPLWVDDEAMSLPQVLSRARLRISRMKAKLIVVDYLQKMRAEAADLREQMGLITGALQNLAKTARISVVLLSQLRRPQNMNERPILIQLKESGNIEADAQVVLLLHRPIDENGRRTGKDWIFIAKNRDGLDGPIPVTFNTDKLRFDPRTMEKEEQSARDE